MLPWSAWPIWAERALRGDMAANVIDAFAELGKDIVYVHNEGYILAHLKARELGIDVPYRYMHLFEYMRDYLMDNPERYHHAEQEGCLPAQLCGQVVAPAGCLAE